MEKKILKILMVAVSILITTPFCAYAMSEAQEDTVTITAVALEGTVSINHDGTPQFDETISVNISQIANNTGTLSYQWTRNSVDIAGQTGDTYILMIDDIGTNIGAKVMGSAETGTIFSDTVLIGKADRLAPSAPTLQSKDHYNVIMVIFVEFEYRIAGGSFSESNAFAGLVSHTEYAFYQRYAQTATHNASPSSAALNITTDYINITNTTKDISSLNPGDGIMISGTVTLIGTQSIRVYCNAGTKLTLNSVNIDVARMPGACAIEFAGNGNRLILSGANTAHSGSQRAAVETSGSLEISGSGSLYAKGGANGAGIGGGNGSSGGDINVSGGCIFAVGSSADDIGGGNAGANGSLSISGASAVFLKSNLSSTVVTSSHTVYSSGIVDEGMAYGYSLPSQWADGDTCYAYIDYCNVLFDTNGANSIASETIGKLGLITRPNDPVQVGLIFAGWYSDSEFIDAFNITADRVYDDMILYAKWNALVTIATNEGGSVDPYGETFVTVGDDLIIECVPDENFMVKEVISSENHNVVVGENNTYTIESIGTEDTISVVFESTFLLGVVTIDHDSTPQCREEVGVNTIKVENALGTLLFQWTRDGKNITGATKEVYILSELDVGHTVGIKVTSNQKEGVLADTIAMKIEKAMKAAPIPPKAIETTTYSVTLDIVEGCEYKMEGYEWQDSNIFEKLEPDTEYVFYQRYSESPSHRASNSSFSFKVTTAGFHVNELRLAEDALRMHKDATEDVALLIQYSILPLEAKNKDIIWSSSNENVAIINSEDGTITALAEGKTTITITAADTQNGIFTDTCVLQVYDPTVVDINADLGGLTGRLIGSKGNALSGYSITLYSNPITMQTNNLGEFSFEHIPYTSHVLIVENQKGEEIGRFTIDWTLGENEKASIDTENNHINIIYTEITSSISIPIEANNDMNNIKVRTVEGIGFMDEEGNEIVSKKVYMLVLMGIIAACIIGVGYILYIGRIQNKEYNDTKDVSDDFYEQTLLEENNEIKIGTMAGTLEDMTEEQVDEVLIEPEPEEE